MRHRREAWQPAAANSTAETAPEKEDRMSLARDLAEFLAPYRAADLPAQTVDYAAMLIASTIASAAMGSTLQSAQIIRDLAAERGGKPEASLWFGNGKKLTATDAAQVNAVMSDAAASDDSDLRNIVHCGTPLTATALALAERTGAKWRGRAVRHRARLRAGRAY